MTKTKVRPWEWILVHADSQSTNKVLSRLTPPFESKTTHLESAGSWQKLQAISVANRWMAAIKFKGLDYALLYCNYKPAIELFEQNSESELNMFLHSCDADGLAEFEWSSDGKSKISFAGQIDGQNFEGISVANRNLERKAFNCMTVVDALQVFYDHCKLPKELYEIPPDFPLLTSTNGRFEFIDRHKKSIQPEVEWFKIWQADGIDTAHEQQRLMEQMGVATEACNLSEIRELIAAGAPLDCLSEHFTPLQKTMHQLDRNKDWEQCAQLLIDSGAPTTDTRGDSILNDYCNHIYSEPLSLKAAKFLLKNDVDVNHSGPNGGTALEGAVLNKKYRVVKLLLKHGADPNAKSRYADGTIIEFVRQRMNEDLEIAAVSQFTKMLEVLTGKPVPVPKTKPLRKELQRENERFRKIDQAKKLLQFVPEELVILESKTSPLSEMPNYSTWTNELLELGFKPAAHFSAMLSFWSVQHSAFCHEQAHVDAYITDGPDCEQGELQLSLGAWNKNGTCTVVQNAPYRNKPPKSQGSFAVLKNAGPKKLFGSLKKKIAKSSVLKIKATNAIERIKKYTEQCVEQIRNQAQLDLDDYLTLPSGEIPRFEIAKVYYPAWDPVKEPEWSTEHVAKKELERLKAPAKERDEFKSKVDAGARLCLLRHYQFAGAPKNSRFMSEAIDATTQLFQLFEDQPRKFSKFWCVEYLAMGLTMAMLKKKSKDAKSICNALKASLVNDSKFMEPGPPIELGQALLLAADYIRDQPIKGTSEFASRIFRSKCTQAKWLCELMDAIDNGGQSEFARAFKKSLNCTISINEKRHGYNAFRQAAWIESLLLMIAQKRKLECPDLSDVQLAWLPTAATI